MFLDKKTRLKIWLNPGLNLTIFQGTGPWPWKVIRKTKGEGVLGSPSMDFGKIKSKQEFIVG